MKGLRKCAQCGFLSTHPQAFTWDEKTQRWLCHWCGQWPIDEPKEADHGA